MKTLRLALAPFYEDAARFNAELAAFVRDANKAHNRN